MLHDGTHISVGLPIDTTVRLNVGTDTKAAIRGDGQFGPSRGFLGVQGATNFDTVPTLDISGLEIGVLGLSTGSSTTDNVGVYGHSTYLGVFGEYSPDQSNWGALGTNGFGADVQGAVTGVNAVGGAFGGRFLGDTGVSSSGMTSAGDFLGRVRITDYTDFGTAPGLEGGGYRGHLRAGAGDLNDGHRLMPPGDWWGLIGTASEAWYQMYGYSFVNMSAREKKRDIQPVEDSVMDLVMQDIDRIKPSFYKYNNETDALEPGLESKFRPNMHLGVILDETPDYLKDNTLNGVDIYAAATLGIAGVKNNRGEIQAIQKALGMGVRQRIEDFGSAGMTQAQVWVPFDAAFAESLNGTGVVPTVTVTPNVPGVSLSVTRKDAEGFQVTATGGVGFDFDWIAMARVSTQSVASSDGEPLPDGLLEQLHLPPSALGDIEAARQAEERKDVKAAEDFKAQRQAEHAESAKTSKRPTLVGEEG
jgi:hypothetical protein